MAGDWIKMRVDLLTSPKVVLMSSALNTDRFRVIGGLLSAWSLFDAHSTDGRLPGYSINTLDELVGWIGFSQSRSSRKSEITSVNPRCGYFEQNWREHSRKLVCPAGSSPERKFIAGVNR